MREVWVVIARTLAEGPNGVMGASTIEVLQRKDAAIESFDGHVRTCEHSSVEVYHEALDERLSPAEAATMLSSMYFEKPTPPSAMRIYLNPDPDDPIHRVLSGQLTQNEEVAAEFAQAMRKVRRHFWWWTRWRRLTKRFRR